MRNVLHWRERSRPLRTDGGDTTFPSATMFTDAQARKVLPKVGVLHVTESRAMSKQMDGQSPQRMKPESHGGRNGSTTTLCSLFCVSL